MTRPLASSIAAVLLAAPATAADLDVRAIADRALPSVAAIRTFDAGGEEIAQGSGFVVAPGRYLVTNYHVIEGAKSAEARLATEAGWIRVVGVVRHDAGRDIAVLRLDAPRPLPALPLGSVADLAVGDPVVAVGSPLGLEGTVSEGIVSAVRNLEGVGRIVQTTAPISPGSSGGPLLDAAGRVVGINTLLVVSGQNLNFAVPADWVAGLLAETAPEGVVPLADLPRRTGEAGGRAGGGSTAYLRGLVFLEREDYTTALAEFIEATEADPRDAKAWFQRAYCEAKLGRYDDAIRDFTKAIRIDPNDADAYFNRALAYLLLGRTSAAWGDYTRLLQLDPEMARKIRPFLEEAYQR